MRNDIGSAADDRFLVILVMLDCSSAFKTVSYNIFNLFFLKLGFSGTVLKWFESFLSDRSFSFDGQWCSFFAVPAIQRCSPGVPSSSLIVFALHITTWRNHGKAQTTFPLLCRLCKNLLENKDVFWHHNWHFNGLELWLAKNFLLLYNEKT